MILATDPDVIFINAAMGAHGHAMWRSVYNFSACQFMAKKFYPEQFAEMDPEKNIREFFDRFMLTDSSISRWNYSYE